MNRTKNSKWPDDVCEVTLQPKQFSFFNLGIPIKYESEAWITSTTIAKRVYYKQVADPTKGALFFFNPEKANPTWKKHLTFITDIGNHRFLTLKEEKHERRPR